MPKAGYKSITVPDSLISKIDDLINKGHDELRNRTQVVSKAIKVLNDFSKEVEEK